MNRSSMVPLLEGKKSLVHPLHYTQCHIAFTAEYLPICSVCINIRAAEAISKELASFDLEYVM